MVDPESIKHPVYTQGENDILIRLALIEQAMDRGVERFGDHETRLRGLERRFWMALGGGTGLLVLLEVLALVGVTR